MLVQFKCVCARPWAFLCVCVSWSGINPCVLWTLWVSVLADMLKHSRSVEAVRQDIPSLSYRLPLLLWNTTEILPHSVHLLLLLLLLSLSSLSGFLCHNFTSYILSPFPHWWPPVDFLSWCLSLFFICFSQSHSHFFSSLLYGIHARLTFRTQRLFPFFYLETKRQNKSNQEGVGESEKACHLLSWMGTVPLKVQGTSCFIQRVAVSTSLTVVFLSKLETLCNLVNMHLVHHTVSLCVCVPLATSRHCSLEI